MKFVHRMGFPAPGGNCGFNTVETVSIWDALKISTDCYNLIDNIIY